ncbi:adenylate/guanylate cyclase domain-containing protein [Nocardioides sp. TRM66260-LWL]|uniref:adenylate/guanylate cyclase domain-containing protein n=1 Tax=Nocardioides sp. TRM66260-LWL TaxID=2874478 RepID=UPI001CC55EFC|nr:adenylate/guanylate cyclase domain-containing protein [Nocardioides sp. TRM66260-LWL]MBZ5734746.1 adenylate/guanylate cyclase domain-containing protein [Nocardioides sp. TRM66260-LWL]
MREQPFGSFLLGSTDQSPRLLRIRVQTLLTIILVSTHLIGALIVVALTAWVLPSRPTGDGIRLALFIAVPVYVGVAVLLGVLIGTRESLRTLRWVQRGRVPDEAERRQALEVPLRLTTLQGGLWFGAVVLFTGLAAILQPDRMITSAATVGLAAMVVCAVAYLLTEFTLRPVSALALRDADVRRRPRGLGVGGRMVMFWLLGTGAPIVGLVITSILVLGGEPVTGRRLALEVLVLGGIVLVFGFLVTLLNARAVVSPVESVRSALERVERGDLDTDLAVYDATELGLLQAGFNRMAAGLRERERLRDLFGRHVGREVAQAAAAGEVRLGGETREVSVLFVDLVGSTTLAADRDPAEVVDLLNGFFAVVVEEIDRRGGIVNKFLGDAVLAVFGAPVDLPDHATRALSAARAMADRLPVEQPQLSAGIGVFTGATVAGNVGTARRLEYTVIGDAVNAAARLVELAKQAPGGIAAAAETLDAASDDERACWQGWRTGDDAVVLRGRSRSTEVWVRA